MQVLALSGEVLEMIADGVLFVDAGGRIADLNEQAERMSGYARAELVGQNVEILLPARFRNRHAAQGDAYQASPVARGMESDADIRLLRRDGVELPVDVALTPSGDGVVAVVRDVSARRESERVLREHSQLLELAHDAIVIRRLDDGT